MLKLRTMVEGAEKSNVWSTANDDPRITIIGKFLRKYKIDEFPQLINVLRGEMALVGPRPEVPEFVAKMTKEERSVILSVKPGITDPASLWDIDEGKTLAGSKDPDGDYERLIWPTKKRLQIEYIKNRSFLGDIKILCQTLLKLAKR